MTPLDHARGVADAVLYEGYLLYPYRAGSGKNQSRWQFGVLGPPGAAGAGTGEDPALATQCLVRPLDGAAEPELTVHLRFLQLQRRATQRVGENDRFEDVSELAVGRRRWLSWDEAVDRELVLGPWSLSAPAATRVEQIVVPGGEEVEPVRDDAGTTVGRLVRSRSPLQARLTVRADHPSEAPHLVRLTVRVENTGGTALDKVAAIAGSFLGAHLLLGVTDGEFVSMTDPATDAADAAARCEQHRCWPVLAGPDGDSTVLLVSPIILYDHPELAPQSAGALFDSTEIDEILTLRVMTLTEEEKAAARATDPRAAEIIDRCDAMSPEAMQQLHGVLRDPEALDSRLSGAPQGPRTGAELADVDLTRSFGFDDEVPWWDPAVDGSVAPKTDVVVIRGTPVSAGSMVRVHPTRRADAQDLFFAGQVARVTAVHSDVDGQTHVAVVLVDDPAADLHDWYGRYLYFAPDELEPLSERQPGPLAEGSQPWSSESVNRKET
jgi:hypothetical protein